MRVEELLRILISLLRIVQPILQKSGYSNKAASAGDKAACDTPLGSPHSSCFLSFTITPVLPYNIQRDSRDSRRVNTTTLTYHGGNLPFLGLRTLALQLTVTTGQPTTREAIMNNFIFMIQLI